MSEVFDPLVKRMSYRKQKRWWNAFMLFYTRLDYTEDENESLMKEMALLSIGKSLNYISDRPKPQFIILVEPKPKPKCSHRNRK